MKKSKQARSEVARLPMPEHLEPKLSSRSLLLSVRNYFYPLYNTDANFKDLLAAVGNKDAITGNRLFDRHNAVGMIKSMAKEVKDSVVVNAKDGEVYRCIVGVMRENELGLKLRRREYQRVTHQMAAE